MSVERVHLRHINRALRGILDGTPLVLGATGRIPCYVESTGNGQSMIQFSSADDHTWHPIPSPPHLVRFFLTHAKIFDIQNTRDSRVECMLHTASPCVFDALPGKHTCGICLSPCVAKTRSAVVLPCGHHFHTQCLRPWILRKEVCPTCRGDISLETLVRKRNAQKGHRLFSA